MRWWIVTLLWGWPVLVSAQTDPCAEGQRWRTSTSDASGAVTLTYVTVAAEPVAPRTGTIAWRTASPDSVELLAIGNDVFARCTDATVRRVAEFGAPVRPTATTHTVSGHRWPDLVQHASRGWVADVHWVFDGARYRVGGDGAHCTSVATVGTLGDGGAPDSPYAELPLGPGEWIDASAPHADEVFRLPLAADPAMLAVGLEDHHDEAMLVILAPEGSGHCVVGVWDWSFGGNGVDFGRDVEQAVVPVSSADATMLLVQASGHMHGGCEEDDDDCSEEVQRWFVLVVTRTRVVLAGASEQRPFRDVDRSGVGIVGRAIAVGPRRFTVDPATLTLRARRAAPPAHVLP